MKTISISWRERGYLRDVFWMADEATAAQAATVARRMITEARRYAGVFNVRANIRPHPTKGGSL
ncbi:hypothetical protein [Silvimonas sp.]|uniref:hypothetical protein n=1 Tax=Silvimonas sp. TaxID=2650811 RepID=UPI00284FE570|nr:hypothetical protein [Silvimonas sp.]MDR3427835.1 hypothetical protein [Silvimonas sp.]